MAALRMKSGNSVTDLKGYCPEVTKKWYLVANRTSAVIYRDLARQFRFVQRLTNHPGDLREAELGADRPGRGFSSAAGGSIHHSLDRTFHHHEQVAKTFAHRIGKVLDTAARDEQFTELVVVAEPHFLGLMRSEFSDFTRKKIRHEVHREYKQGSDQDLRERILSAIQSE